MIIDMRMKDWAIKLKEMDVWVTSEHEMLRSQSCNQNTRQELYINYFEYSIDKSIGDRQQ